jgi:uncharacterized protein RhaS with RHS repeats
MRANIFLLAVALLTLGSMQALAATTYEYDTLGRLSQVCYDNGLTITYNYDAMGNRTSVVTQTGVPCS